MKKWLEPKKEYSETLNPYKGYQIEKSWRLNSRGKRIPNTIRYTVIDENDDWIGDVYKTLSEAKAFIDSLNSSSIEASSSYRPFGLITHSDRVYGSLLMLDGLVSEHDILQHLINYFSASDIQDALADIADELVNLDED